ncbi:MAG: esterase family protein, partial [Bacteroidaceae bacterium]|nr:esterase family protein [Bacteroidaceae bacterium]
MKTKKLISLFALLFLTTSIFAFEQKEIAVKSNSMNKDVLVTVITPEGYSTEQSYPVIYLLHGHGGNHTVWTKDGAVGQLADQYNLIVVMPDGARDSW